jgi:hypothetical protein
VLRTWQRRDCRAQRPRSAVRTDRHPRVRWLTRPHGAARLGAVETLGSNPHLQVPGRRSGHRRDAVTTTTSRRSGARARFRVHTAERAEHRPFAPTARVAAAVDGISSTNRPITANNRSSASLRTRLTAAAHDRSGAVANQLTDATRVAVGRVQPPGALGEAARRSAKRRRAPRCAGRRSAARPASGSLTARWEFRRGTHPCVRT